MANKTAYVVVQQGGTSQELYLWAGDTKRDARAFKRDCASGSYSTTEPVQVPSCVLKAVEDAGCGTALYDFLEAVVQSTAEL